MTEQLHISRAFRIYRIAVSAMFLCNFAEILLVPIVFSFVPPHLLSHVLGPERWFAQSSYVDNLVENGFNKIDVIKFSTELNIFIGTSLVYLLMRLGLMLIAPRPVFRIKVVGLSLFCIATCLFDISAGIGQGKGLYSISSSKPLVLDEAMIFALYLTLISFAGELLAQVIALGRLQYADRWSV